jgi:hypothetical protein
LASRFAGFRCGIRRTAGNQAGLNDDRQYTRNESRK